MIIIFKAEQMFLTVRNHMLEWTAVKKVYKFYNAICI